MGKQLKEQQRQQLAAQEAGVQYQLQGRLQEIVDIVAATEAPTRCFGQCVEYLATHLGQVLQQTREHTDDSSGLANVLADWKWALQQQESGALRQYGGEYVAVLEEKDLAHGKDPSKLRQSVAKRFEVDPERVVVLFIDPA